MKKHHVVGVPNLQPTFVRKKELNMIGMANDEGIGLLDADDAASFAFRAAMVSGVQEFQAVGEPGCCGDFLRALQQLGADPRIARLQRRRNFRRMTHVHVSCSYEDWTTVFGEPECVEEIGASAMNRILSRWKHFCTDKTIVCIGHLFEKSPKTKWVVLMRLMIF